MSTDTAFVPPRHVSLIFWLPASSVLIDQRVRTPSSTGLGTARLYDAADGNSRGPKPL